MGHDVHLAYDGPSALQAADAHRPDVVLLDIGLPGLDGYEVARRLRTRVAMRRHVDRRPDRLRPGAATAQRSREAGFDHHLVKPADATELERVIAGGRSSSA